MAKRKETKALSVFGPEYQPMKLEDEFEGWATRVWDTWAREFFDFPSFPEFESIEGDNELVLKANVRGIKPEDIEVVLEGLLLTFKAVRKSGKGSAKETMKQHIRTVWLPYAVDCEKVNARVAKGILEIRISKPEEARPHKINIVAREQALKQKKTPKPGKKK